MEAATTSAVVAGVVTSAMLQGVQQEIVGMIPVILPVAITILGIRKAISFLFGTMRSA